MFHVINDLFGPSAIMDMAIHSEVCSFGAAIISLSHLLTSSKPNMSGYTHPLPPSQFVWGHEMLYEEFSDYQEPMAAEFHNNSHLHSANNTSQGDYTLTNQPFLLASEGPSVLVLFGCEPRTSFQDSVFDVLHPQSQITTAGGDLNANDIFPTSVPHSSFISHQKVLRLPRFTLLRSDRSCAGSAVVIMSMSPSRRNQRR
jgi:hypothetical protein